MQLYLKFLGIHLKSQMQYKASLFLTLMGQFLGSTMALIGIYFMYTRFHTIEGFTYSQTLFCFATVLVAFSLASTFGRGFESFTQMISNGEFDWALVRPMNIIYQVLAAKMELSRLGLLVQSVVLFCYAVPRSGIAWTWYKVLTVCLMICCGCLIFFGLFLLYAGITFFTLEGLELMYILTTGGLEFGRYPYAVYGKNVLHFLTYVVPLALFQYYPFLYLLDREQSIAYMLSPLFGLPFIVLSYAFFRFGLYHYKSIGS